jgi:hypothetical protein
MEGSDRGLLFRHCLEGLSETTKISQDSRSAGQDLNSGPLEFEDMLLTDLWISAFRREEVEA